MISGIGCDIMNIQRIEKTLVFLKHFEKRILRDDELKEIRLQHFKDIRTYACSLAKYYAGKEAFVKALGIGFRNGIYMRDIQVLHNELGKPYLKISGKTAKIVEKAKNQICTHVSLSDDYPFAQAFVIIEEKRESNL